MKNRIHVLLLICILIAVTLAILVRRERVAPSIQADAEQAVIGMETSSPAPELPSSNFATYEWRTGDHACWQFAVSLRLAGNSERLAQSSETRLGGKMQFVVLNSDSKRVTLAAALSDSYFLAGDKRARGFEEFVDSIPAILTLTPEGNLLDVSFPRHVAAEDRKILCLAYGWEFVARNTPFYQEEEHTHNDNGEANSAFRANYQRLSDLSRIHKTRHLASTAPAESDVSQSVTYSEFSATVGSIWVAEMTGSEDSLIYVNGSVFAASRVSIWLKQTNAPVLSPILSDLLSNPASRLAFSKSPDAAASSVSRSVSEAIQREALAARWGSVPFEQVLHPMQTVANRPMREIVKPLRDLKQWLAVHLEDGPGMVLQSLQAIQPDQTSLSGLLIHGLAEADTLPARKALAGILEVPDSYPPSAVIQAAVAAGDLGSKADQPMMETLIRLMDSSLSDGAFQLSDTALFAFARIARGDSASQKFLAQRVAPWLEDNAVPEDTVKGLSALANAAVDDPRFVQRATDLAKSSDTGIRLAVVDYLGSLANSTTARTTIDQLILDPDPQVRQEAERLRVQ